MLLLAAVFAAACGGPGSAGPGASGAADSLNRGLTAHTAGRLDEAVAAYFETLSKDPKNKFAFYNLGQIAQSQNRLPAAEAYYNLGLLLRAAGDTAGAQQELATAQRLDPKLVPPTPSATPQRQVSPTPT